MWWMFYTGTSREDKGLVQTIGAAVSEDLMTWTKLSSEPLARSDSEHYEVLSDGTWHDEAWRDPWVFKPEGDTRWHMLVTARAKHGDPAQRGVLGHAVSEDMKTWKVLEALSKPGQGFGHLEVFQYEVVDDVPILLFCCGWRELSEERLAQLGKLDATYSVSCSPDLKDVDFTRALPFIDNPVYAGRLIKGPDEKWNLIGFVNEVHGEFVGELSDPIPVTASLELGLILRQ
jgi:beta-fructofuranosidase